MNEDDARRAVAALKAQTRLRRKQTRLSGRSRLDRYKGDLILLKRQGATIAELQRWLREHRIKVVHSTVARWLQKHLDPDGSIQQS